MKIGLLYGTHKIWQTYANLLWNMSLKTIGWNGSPDFGLQHYFWFQVAVTVEIGWFHGSWQCDLSCKTLLGRLDVTWCDQWPLALQPQQPQQPWGVQKWGHSAQKATFGCRGGAGGAAYASPAMNQFRSISVCVSTCQLRYPKIAKLILTVSLVSLTVRILCSWLWSHVAINSAARWNVDSWTLRCSKV